MIKKIKENIWQISSKLFGSHVYLIKTKNKNIIIDTGSIYMKKEIIEDLETLDTPPEEINIVLLTHHHFDHIDNLNLFKNTKIYGSKEDFSEGKEVIDVDKFKIEGINVIKTPGHTKGSVCFFMPKEKVLFSGDAMFDRGLIGRTDFPNSSPEKMESSLKKLRDLKYETLCAGHGYDKKN